MKLVSNWRSALKMLSVQISTLGGAVSTSYAVFYPQLKEYVSPTVMMYVVGATFILTIVGRMIDQELTGKADATDSTLQP